MLRPFIADLHVHTALSPCADDRMTPRAILERAGALGINLLAATDHNASENAEALVTLSREYGIAVLPGMELQTREEVHLLCLFDSVEAAAAWQEVVHQWLPVCQNVPQVFGRQLLFDSRGLHRPDEYPRLLQMSAELTVEEAVQGVREMGGLCLPAHVDRPSYGLLCTLGLLPDKVTFEAAEISPHLAPESALLRYPALKGTTLFTSSDAHWPDQVGSGVSEFWLAAPTIAELKLAFARKDGRSVRIPYPYK